jgi:hypothetical protein
MCTVSWATHLSLGRQRYSGRVRALRSPQIHVGVDGRVYIAYYVTGRCKITANILTNTSSESAHFITSFSRYCCGVCFPSHFLTSPQGHSVILLFHTHFQPEARSSGTQHVIETIVWAEAATCREVHSRVQYSHDKLPVHAMCAHSAGGQ